MKYAIRSGMLLVFSLMLATGAWAQWSSNPAQDLNLSNIPGADQVQPKILPLPNNSQAGKTLSMDSPPPRPRC